MQTDTQKYRQVHRKVHRLRVRQVQKEKARPTKLTARRSMDRWE